MRQPTARKHAKPPTCEPPTCEPPTCDTCGGPLETAATVRNPSATIRPNSLARCPACLRLFVIGTDLRPDLSCDEAAFNDAMNANPEVREWARRTTETARIRAVAEIKAECVVARQWLTEQAGPDLADDLATLDAYAAGYDAKGFTSAPRDIRLRASAILAQILRQTRH